MRLQIPFYIGLTVALFGAVGVSHQLRETSRATAFLEPCRVVVEGDDEAIVRAYFALLDEAEKEVMVVLIPEKFGLATVFMTLKYRDISITGPNGVDLPLGGARAVILRADKYLDIKKAFDDRNALGHGGDPANNIVDVRIRVLVSKK